jgi:hypothetical protein
MTIKISARRLNENQYIYIVSKYLPQDPYSFKGKNNSVEKPGRYFLNGMIQGANQQHSL